MKSTASLETNSKIGRLKVTSSLRTLAKISYFDLPLKGGRPLRRIYAIIPILQMSTFKS
jgi:hypothetical protein